MSAELIACSFCFLVAGIVIGFGVAGIELEKTLGSFKKRFMNINEVAGKAINTEYDKDKSLTFIACESDLNLPEGYCERGENDLLSS